MKPRGGRDDSKGSTAAKTPFHSRNRHQGRYDFARLRSDCPELGRFLIITPGGEISIDFADPVAVRELNRALLKSQYGILHWEFPDGFLCPPVPGRADYLHGLADLLAVDSGGTVPMGPQVRVLDIGVGASCIYPLLGHADYGWRFRGSDVDPEALQSATAIVAANAGLAAAIELRLQPDRTRIFAGLVDAQERFDLSMCNPPFHASAADAARGSQRKWRNLGRPVGTRTAPELNFGGRASELVCPGGEVAFVQRMIGESTTFGSQVLWFSSLLSKAASLATLRRALRAVGASDVQTVAMAQGSKHSRFLAWTFFDREQRRAWALQRATNP